MACRPPTGCGLKTSATSSSVPAGEAGVSDPYIDLRAWEAREPDAVFALAGEAAAWHLGYLPRIFTGTTAVWLRSSGRVPHGLRSAVSQVRLAWSASAAPSGVGRSAGLGLDKATPSASNERPQERVELEDLIREKFGCLCHGVRWLQGVQGSHRAAARSRPPRLGPVPRHQMVPSRLRGLADRH